MSTNFDKIQLNSVVSPLQTLKPFSNISYLLIKVRTSAYFSVSQNFAV